MIKEVTMYALCCDKCGEPYINDTMGYCAFVTDSFAIDDAKDADWLEINDRMLCPKCYHYDEKKDEYVENN